MKKLRFAFLLTALWSLSGSAYSEDLKLKMGAAASDGVVGFTLSSQGETLEVEVAVSPMSASAKATAVSDAVAAQDSTGTWSVEASGTSLTFKHLVDGVWVDVEAISDVQDTTGGGTQVKTEGGALVFNLKMGPETTASGVDASGKPAFITISLTSSLVWTHAIQAGDTPQGILDLFAAFLADQSEEAVEVVRENPSVMILKQQDAESALSINWQVTDTGLLAGVQGSADLGVIDR
jgi:hypothetical protein